MEPTMIIQLPNMKLKGLGFLLLGIIFWACDPDKNDMPNDYDYFPLRLNMPLVYQVTETRYSAGNSEPTILSWQEKDEAIRISESPDGFPVYIYSRSRRDNPEAPWQKVKEYSVTRYPDRYLLTLDNTTTVPMIFPINPLTSWDLNAYNTRVEEACRYDFLHQEKTIGSLHFPKTIQVSGRDFTNDPIVRYNLGYTQYALGVGLIFDEQTDYEYCQEQHCYGQQQIISGLSTIKQLIAY